MNHSFLMPHGWCMTWNPRLIGLHVASDAMVALSYYSIPAALFVFARYKKAQIPVRPLLLLFGLFILLCGGGHAIDIISIWKPIYWFKGWWNLGTAATSVITAIVLIPKVAEFIRMPETAERLQREATVLQEKHGILRAVLDGVCEGILLVGPKGDILVSNAAAGTIAADWPNHASTDRDVLKLPDGRVVERFTTSVVGFGQLYVLRDVTEQRKSEAQRRRLEKIVATMKQGFAIVSMDASLDRSMDEEKVLATNQSFDEMHGYARGELDGAPMASLYAGEPEERDATAAAISEAAERDGFWEGEALGARKDGSAFISQVRVNLHVEDDERMLSMLQMDVTEQKRREEQGQRIQQKLLHTQKLESLGVLAGGVAHDFNNLLTGILGNASLAYDVLPADSPLRSNLRDVVSASERAADLTRQLLAYSGKGRFVVEPIDVSGLTVEISKLVRMSMPKTVRLTVNAASDLPFVEGDAGQLQQIVMNLAINGAEAIGELPGEVHVSTGVLQLEEADIKGAFSADGITAGKFVFFEVQDTGCGMDEATRAQIFDPFFTTKFTGRGLGLAAALGIVRGHKGAIKVYSDVGRGSTFKVYLPVWEGERAPAQPGAPDRDLTGSGMILIVDDEDVVRRTTQNTLRHFGYEVVLAENGMEAIDIFHKSPDRISLILLDMTMPVMSGEETLRQIRKIRPEVPVILTSGFNEAEAIRRFAGKGLAGFIQKPFTSAKLAEKVKSAATGA
ncbi:MAG: hybrid sensor histidine kinase/response regulator [Bryobacteraceae bacterium]